MLESATLQQFVFTEKRKEKKIFIEKRKKKRERFSLKKERKKRKKKEKKKKVTWSVYGEIPDLVITEHSQFLDFNVPSTE